MAGCRRGSSSAEGIRRADYHARELQSIDAPANAENAGILPCFDVLVSTDANHPYKPDARAYRLGMDQLHLAKSEIAFAAFGGWDAAGAKSFGYPTFWVNRFSQPLEELGIQFDGTSTNIDGLLDFVFNQTPKP